MALLPVLLNEERVQIDDKTRLDASKCFVTTGSTAISVLTIKPSGSDSAISVFNTTVDNRYLDWIYSDTKWDIDSTNNKIYFNEGGSTLTATLASASYTRAALLTEIQSKMNSTGSFVYTVSESQDKITISATGQYKLLPLIMGANLLPSLGWFDTTNQSTSQTSERFDYCIKRITVSVGDGASTVTKDFYIKIHSVDGDALYSTDKDIIALENNLSKWIPAGRASFLNIHRTAQTNILDWLDQNGFRDINDKRYRKFDILNVDEVKNWSKYMTLRMIFFSLHNSVDDVFKKKSDYYEKMEINSRSRFILSLDQDKDGLKDLTEENNTWNGRVYLR